MRKKYFFLFQNFTLLEVLTGCELSMIFSFFAIFSKSFWSSGWWILPADEDPACSRGDTADLFFVFRDFPVAAEESGCELSMIFSCRPENENNSKFAQYIAFWISFTLISFRSRFGVQDDGYYLRIWCSAASQGPPFAARGQSLPLSTSSSGSCLLLDRDEQFFRRSSGRRPGLWKRSVV